MSNPATEGPAEPLTRTERRVLGLILQRQDTRQIAATLYVSRRTVDFHKANIRRKAGERNTMNAVLRYCAVRPLSPLCPAGGPEGGPHADL